MTALAPEARVAVAFIRDQLGDTQTARLVASTAAVKAELNGMPLSVREVAERAQISKSAAHRTLVRLTAAGIAAHGRAGWTLKGAPAPAEVQSQRARPRRTLATAPAAAATRCGCRRPMICADEDGDQHCVRCGRPAT